MDTISADPGPDKFAQPTGAPIDRNLRVLSQLLQSSVGVAKGRALALLLIKRFGSIQEVVSAPPKLLMETIGVGPATAHRLEAARELAQILARERLSLNKTVLGSWSELVDYCHVQMALLPIEHFRVFFSTKETA